MTNKEKFIEEYTKQFKLAYPNLPIEKTEHLIEKSLSVALDNINSVLIDGAAFKATFKALGIKHNYTAAREFLGQ